jgi:hypothetical protein
MSIIEQTEAMETASALVEVGGTHDRESAAAGRMIHARNIERAEIPDTFGKVMSGASGSGAQANPFGGADGGTASGIDKDAGVEAREERDKGSAI